MNKTELIHNLVKVLEQMEDEIVFTVSYSYAEFLESHHFTPAWDFDKHYYEIQYDNSNDLQVLEFPQTGYFNEGRVLTEEEITKLTKDLVEFWAEEELKKEENIKQRIEADGWQHFLKGNIITSYFDEDVLYSTRTEKLTRDEIIERYKRTSLRKRN